MSQKNVIAVTGATGRVGHQVAQILLSSGHTVRAVARTAEKLQSLGARGAEVRAGSFADPAFLTSVFRGATAAFVLTPIDISAPDVNAEQNRNVDGIVEAIHDSGVKHVVLLSSWGAEVPDRIGGILGCHRFEQLLDRISGVNVVHLRPVWFMENFLWNIGLIKMASINGLAIKSGFPFPMIATRDIAPVAADYLATLDFKGRNVHYLNGPKDYTMTEVTRILGASIGKPDLRYVEFPEAIFRKGLVSNGGLSPNAADMAIEINRGIDTGRVKSEPRSKSNTTPTTLEAFAQTVFAPAFKATRDASRAERLGGWFLRGLLFFARSKAEQSPNASAAGRAF